MKTRTEKINDIISVRKETAREIESLQKWLWDCRNALVTFRQSITAPDSVVASNAATATLAARSSAIEADIVSDSVALDKVHSHFAKDTLAVAVVGQAGMGKSTFLQSLTGLSDLQIPAGSGRACTSTQSRIDNLSIGPGFAEVFYYSRADMLGILEECYSLLKWPAPSFRSLEDFVRDFDMREKPAATALDSLWRLLKTYRDNATALEREIFAPKLRSKRIELGAVADSVTYSQGESRSENLGIARVEIHCRFPSDDVGRLSVVDTPGMNAASEDRDKIILEKVLDETADFVLFVGIPAERGISQKEREMFDNCRKCARQVSEVQLDRKAFYIANQAVVRDSQTGEVRRNGADPEFNALWKQDFESGVIPAERLVSVDVKDPDAVRDKVLDPMIDYLVRTLPELDGAELTVAKSKISAYRVRIGELVNEARASLGLARAVDQNVYRTLSKLFNASFPSFSASLKNHVDKLTPKENDAVDDDGGKSNPFTQKVTEVFNKYRSEIGTILSEEKVQREMNLAPGQGGAAFFNLLSYLRCYMRGCFSGLEDACHDMVESAKAELSDIFVDALPGGGGFGNVNRLKDTDGKPLRGSAFFNMLATICRETAEKDGCKNLEKQISAFETFELRFSGFLEHKVSSALTPLRQGTFDRFMEGRVDYADAKSIRSALLSLGEAAVNQVACALVEQSAAEPSEAIFAVLEKFVDQTLRTEGMTEEWKNLYEVVRAEVWPEVFDPNSATNRNTFALRECVDTLDLLTKKN